MWRTCEFLHRLAPLDLAEEWDNVGLLVVFPHQAAHRVMTCLTVTHGLGGRSGARSGES